MKISIVVAMADNSAIGANGKLLWRLPKDMQYFKEVTWGHHVLMGRKTWDSIPPKFSPLPGRVNIIVTRQKGYVSEGAIVVESVEDGIEIARRAGEQELMIIGGGEIYKQALPLTKKIYLTKVHHTFTDADTFFPELDMEQWSTLNGEWNMADEKNEFDFEFIVLERKG
ncbi:MAG TPA: dihydrofolate reductase [Chitinophagales bacterium]|nr:dihydrofolate reductase [Chitinophagales bacterium]